MFNVNVKIIYISMSIKSYFSKKDSYE